MTSERPSLRARLTRSTRASMSSGSLMATVFMVSPDWQTSITLLGRVSTYGLAVASVEEPAQWRPRGGRRADAGGLCVAHRRWGVAAIIAAEQRNASACRFGSA